LQNAKNLRAALPNLQVLDGLNKEGKEVVSDEDVSEEEDDEEGEEDEEDEEEGEEDEDEDEEGEEEDEDEGNEEEATEPKDNEKIVGKKRKLCEKEQCEDG